MRNRLSDKQQRQALSFISYVYHWFSAEIAYFKRTGNPSEKLALIDRIGTPTRLTFPVSLSTTAGVKVFARFLSQYENYYRNIPEFCFKALETVSKVANSRRLESSRLVAYRIGEAVLGWASANFQASVIFSFEMVRKWCATRHGVSFSNKEIKRTLEWWSQQPDSPITVTSWGKRNDYGNSTKIKVNLGAVVTEIRGEGKQPQPSAELLDQATTWMLSVAPANTTVFQAIDVAQNDTEGFRGQWVKKNAKRFCTQEKFEAELTAILMKATTDGRDPHKCRFRSYPNLQVFLHCCSGVSYRFGEEPWATPTPIAEVIEVDWSPIRQLLGAAA